MRFGFLFVFFFVYSFLLAHSLWYFFISFCFFGFEDFNTFLFGPFALFQKCFDIGLFCSSFFVFLFIAVFVGLKAFAVIDQECTCIDLFLIFVKNAFLLSSFAFFYGLCSFLQLLSGSFSSLLFPFLLEYLLFIFRPFYPFYFFLFIFILVFFLGEVWLQLSDFFSVFKDFFFKLFCLIQKGCNLRVFLLLFVFINALFEILNVISNALYFVDDLSLFVFITLFNFF